MLRDMFIRPERLFYYGYSVSTTFAYNQIFDYFGAY